MEILNYESPKMEVIEIAVEQGFATSTEALQEEQLGEDVWA